jgi:hypothetical protein
MNEEYDFNGNGKLDPEERAIMLEDMRRKMIDADQKRDSQRRMAWFCLTGMLLFPFGVVLTEWMQLPNASTLAVEHEQHLLCLDCRNRCCILWLHKLGEKLMGLLDSLIGPATDAGMENLFLTRTWLLN